MCLFRKQKKEKKDPELIQDIKDFRDYWKERIDAIGGQSRSVTIKSDMAKRLSRILSKIDT